MLNFMEEIKIQGNRYLGRFFIQERSSTHRNYVDGEYAGARWADEVVTWWEGNGMIEDKQIGSRERFSFRPKGNRLKDIMSCVDDEKNAEKIDLALQLLYNQARKSEEIYPKINTV